MICTAIKPVKSVIISTCKKCHGFVILLEPKYIANTVADLLSVKGLIMAMDKDSAGMSMN